MEIKPSNEAISKVQEMAKEAALNDKWMTPSPEEHIDDEDNPDLGDISQHHRDGWHETTHFQLNYGNRISDLADEEEERLTGRVGGIPDPLDRYEGLYVPLRDAFWDEWEEHSKFYELAQQAIDAI